MTETLEEPRAAARGATVTILTDEDGLAAALKNALAADGLACDCCHFDEAERLVAASEVPALVVADLSCNGSAAFALCQALRRRDGVRPCHLLVLHHSGRGVDRRRAAALGADGFLAKPFALDDLRREVARLLAPERG